MSKFQNNSGYPQAGANGQYAVMTPPPRQEKKVVPLAYTAGGGLLVGVVTGLLLISGGAATKAVAASTPALVGQPGAGEPEPALPAEQELAEVGTDEPGGEDLEPAMDEPATDVPVEEAAPEPEPLQAAITFDVTPPDVVSDLKIEVDGESLSAQEQLVTLDPVSGVTTVRVVAVASGYRDFEKSIKVTGDMRIPIKMRKVPSVTKSSGDKDRRRKGQRDGKSNEKNTGNKSSGPGGLLDL